MENIDPYEIWWANTMVDLQIGGVVWGLMTIGFFAYLTIERIKGRKKK